MGPKPCPRDQAHGAICLDFQSLREGEDTPGLRTNMWVEVPGLNTHLHVLNAETRAVTLTAPLGVHQLSTCCHPGTTAPLIPSVQSHPCPTPNTHTHRKGRWKLSPGWVTLWPGPGGARSGPPCVTSGLLGRHGHRRWRRSLSQRPQRAVGLSVSASLTPTPSEGSAKQDRMLLC